MSNEELLKSIKDELNTMDTCTIVLENPDYVTAIIGYTDEGSLVYDYDLMVKYLVDNEDMSEEDACDFISYNTMRAIPYMSSKGAVPTIVHKFLV